MQISAPEVGVNYSVVEGEPPHNEDGYFPVHYRWSNWPCEGKMVAISAHHFTHRLPGASGGPFLRINDLKQGDVITLKVYDKFGGRSCRYRVSGQRWFACGKDIWNCPSASVGFPELSENRLVLTTCIGDGSWRRFVYAFPVRGPPERR